MQYVIYGFTGSGKSHYLKTLSLPEGYVALDLDNYILNQFKDFKDLASLIEATGWQWFRDIELKSVEELLERNENIFLALGGGSLSQDLKTLLVKSNVNGVYIKETFDICWERIKADTGRGIVQFGKEKCAELYLKRCNLFNELTEELNESNIISSFGSE